jgi:5-methylcytosine-specific restriction protein B
MLNNEIKEGINYLCDLSKEVSNYYKKPETIVNKLNNIPQEELEKLKKYYSKRSGVIVNFRKEILENLLANKKLTYQSFQDILTRHRTNKERKFVSHNTMFALIHPLLTIYGHERVRVFAKELIEETINRLNLQEYVKSVFYDFQGPRQQGHDVFWLAIYNKEQPSQSTGLQIFLNIKDGQITYGFYRHSTKEYEGGKISKTKEDFNYDEMINYFSENIDKIKEDHFVSGRVLKISSDESLFKICVNKDNLEFIKKENLAIDKSWTEEHKKLFSEKFDSNTYFYLTTFENNRETPFLIARFKDSEIIEDSDDNNPQKTIEILAESIKDVKIKISNVGISQIDIDEIEKYNKEIFVPFFDKEIIIERKNAVELTDDIKNFIFYGPPGTGKTYKALQESIKIIIGKNILDIDENNKNKIRRFIEEEQLCFITFHQNYTYEDFVVGIKPDIEKENLVFKKNEGIFYKIVKKAEKDYFNSNKKEVKKYVLIIDEINRANISKVFGELITLLEEDKRIGGKNELRVTLPTGEPNFGIPPNLYIIGTMNTADKSVAPLDIALRRRFYFKGIYPSVIELKEENDKELLESLNGVIYKNKKSPDYLIGHAYFMNKKDSETTDDIVINKIIPLLMEYFNGKIELVEKIFKDAKMNYKYDEKTFSWKPINE